MTAHQRSELRSRLRGARLELLPLLRRRASLSLAQRIARLPQFRRAKLMAGYVANDGEIDPLPLLRQACDLGKTTCLPAIDRPQHGDMLFLRYAPGDLTRRNRYGIPEPLRRSSPVVPYRELDLVLVPVVAFDTQGNRLGMGGGYYDRQFAACLDRGWQRPTLIGIAYELQKLSHLPSEDWDVPLDAVVTECGVYR